MSHRWLPGLLAALVLSAPVAALDTPETEIGRLVRQLGDAQPGQRHAASEGLKRIGPPALPALRKALDNPDAEVRRRAGELVQLLEIRLDSERALTPTKVKLDYDDLPLEKVLQDLTRQTNYRFRLASKDRALAGRRVTLATGELPFWDAIDRLSRAARIGCQIGGLEGLENFQQDQAPAKGRARYYTPPRIGAENEFVITDGPPPPADACSWGAVRMTLRPSAAESKDPGQNVASGMQRLQREAPPARPGPPRLPPVQAGAPGGIGGRGQPEPMPGDGQRRPGLRDADDPRRMRTLILEVDTEPKVQWRGPLQVRTEPLEDEKKQEIDNVGSGLANRRNDPHNMPIQVIGNGPGGRQVIIQGADLMPPGLHAGAAGKQEIALHCRLPENPGKVLPVLRGCLVGQVQMPREPVLEVPDLANAGKQTFKGKDNLELLVAECTMLRPGYHRLVVELHQPGAANPLGPGAQVQMNQFQVGGNRGGQIGNSLTSPDFAITDAKGRELRVRSRSESPIAGKAGLARSISLFLQGENDADGVPRRLVYSVSREATVEVPFEFRNVPLP